PQEVRRVGNPDHLARRAPILPDGFASQLKLVRRGPAQHRAARIDDRLHPAVTCVLIYITPEVVLGDQTVRWLLPAVGPVCPPVHHHAWTGVEAAQDLRQRPAGGGEQELVDVDERDPAGLGSMTLDAVRVGAPLSGNEGPSENLDYPRCDLWLQLNTPVVAAPVVIQIEALHTLNAMETHPLCQVASFVSEDRAHR